MKNLLHKCFIEAVGIFFLTLTIAFTTGNPIAVGAMLTALIYMGYSISGAHFNPATTLAVLIIGKIKSKEALLYVLAQVIGVALASLFYHFIYGETRIFFLYPDKQLNILKPLGVEIVFTFAMMVVILYTAAYEKTKGNSYYGLAIGLVVLALAYAAGYISGGAFNPAIGCIPIFMETILGFCQCKPVNHAWIYAVGPFAGAAVAAFIFKWFTKENIQEINS